MTKKGIIDGLRSCSTDFLVEKVGAFFADCVTQAIQFLEASTGTETSEQAVSVDDLNLINKISHRPLSADEVYVFSIRLCDNEIDRDGERFPVDTLNELASMFIGMSGIFDHQWITSRQNARIFKTELVTDETTITVAGDPLCYLKGYAYIVKSEYTKPLIDEIENGIKKEISVGCSVNKAQCSICGEDIYDKRKCSHEKGREYNGKVCWADLLDVADVYEWSFVVGPNKRHTQEGLR